MIHIPARVKTISPSPQAAGLMQESSQTQHVQGDQWSTEIMFYTPGAAYREPQRASHQRNQPRNTAPVAAKKRDHDETARRKPTKGNAPRGAGHVDHELRGCETPVTTPLSS
jgi:hypothetical protein